MDKPIIYLLERYTIKHPKEVLIVRAEIDSEIEEIAIFKGFSSSLTKATAFDPDIPILPAQVKILGIDRVASPYQPDAPNYLQQNITWEEFKPYLQ